MYNVAVIRVDEHDQYSREILGLPLLSRLVLSLKSDGFSHFIILSSLEDSKPLENILKNLHNEYDVYIDLIADASFKQKISEFFSQSEKLFLIYTKVNTCPDILISKIKDLKESMKDSRNYMVKIVGNGDDGVVYILRVDKKKWEVINNNSQTLEGFLQYIEREKKLELVNVDGGEKLFLRNKEDFTTCEKTLLKNLVKHDDGIISRHINRKVSTFISKRLVKTRITPNMISIMSHGLMLLAGLLLALGGTFYWVLGGIITQFSSIIDGCDGEIARLRFKPSPYGALLDTLLDRYSDIILIGAIYFYYSKYFSVLTNLLFILVSLSAVIMSGLARKEYTLRLGHPPRENVLIKLTRRDMRLFIVFVSASILNLLYPFSLFVSVFVHSLLIHLIIVYKYLLSPFRSLSHNR